MLYLPYNVLSPIYDSTYNKRLPPLQLISRDLIFRPRTFPKGSHLQLSSDSRMHSSNGAPQIIFSPSGALTPFQLKMQLPRHRGSITLQGKLNGEITLQQS